MPEIALESVTVVDGDTVRLDEVSMVVPDGAFVGVIGASGSGKTTLLRVVAGLERLDGGAVRLGGADVTAAVPGDRDVAVVFQQPTMLGRLSTRRNIAFPLELRRLAAAEIRQRVDIEARALGIEELLVRAPDALSHGEQQMVQIARALVRGPKTLLLDEPFAALDEPVRRKLRREIAVLQSGYGATALMATNDSDDIVGVVEAVAVLHAGRLMQYADTATVVRRPATIAAAASTGPVSFVAMTVVRETTGYWLLREDPGGGELVRLRAWSPALAGHVDRVVSVAIRPSAVAVTTTGSVPGRVDRVAPASIGGAQVDVAGAPIRVGKGAIGGAQVGDRVRLRVDEFHVFDPVTELRLD